jgi:hypothetical protein
MLPVQSLSLFFRITTIKSDRERAAAAQDAQQKLKDAYFDWARKSDFVPEIEAVYSKAVDERRMTRPNKAATSQKPAVNAGGIRIEQESGKVLEPRLVVLGRSGLFGAFGRARIAACESRCLSIVRLTP